MALLESNMQALKLGEKAKEFTLLGTDDKMHSLNDIAGKDENINLTKPKTTIVMFMCNHCPYVKGINNRINKIREMFTQEELVIVGINSNNAANYPDDSFENMKLFHKKFHVDYYLLDETQEVARAYHATCTPDIFLFDSGLKLVYHGRIDDGYIDESKVKQHDLVNAIRKTISGEKIEFAQKASMGCSIKWKN
ncbi:TPA: thioredoxin family protein [Candidatus Woesearchaeota archaeon]|nr:thioredoxin family protein [Candidatus Woesearchaeota archaeon]